MMKDRTDKEHEELEEVLSCSTSEVLHAGKSGLWSWDWIQLMVGEEWPMWMMDWSGSRRLDCDEIAHAGNLEKTGGHVSGSSTL